ncbi:MAG: hypothetical protein FJZ58_00785, partial [Chlamydiae bacterium]|nr:hypothetical protein [Chlamydiota bacterium]
MGTTLYLIIFLLLQVFPLLAGEEKNQSREHLKKQILYAAPQGERSKTISLYRDYQKLLGRHDFEVLQALATLWIEQEARSPSVEKQLLALFAYDLCHLQVPTDLLENGLASTSPQVQRASLALIHKGQEDLADFLLNKAMSSSFLPIRLEAAFHMAHRKSPSVTGQLESLMHRLPAPLHYFFPEFFALIGTSDAVHVLRHLIDDPMPATRVEAILSAARHGRDDLLPSIRAAATHQDYAEQEAAAFALGQLRDSLSTKKLQKLAKSPTTSVQLAACYALYLLGQTQGVQVILQEAKQGNVFAMILLGEIPEQEQTLLPLLS